MKDEDASAQRLQESAAIQVESVLAILEQLVALGLDLEIDRLHSMTRSSPRLLQHLGGTGDRREDSRIRSTTADIAVHVLDDLLTRGIGFLLSRATPDMIIPQVQ